MDVTTQVNRQMVVSGAGSARPEAYAVNRSLNYAKGSNSLVNAASERVTVAPSVRNFQDSVGLFGAENIFIKIDLDILNSSYANEDGVLENDYKEAVILSVNDTTFEYQQAFADYSLDLTVENTFEPAQFTNELTFTPDAVAKVTLNNLKTGNKYNDCWFDTRLYTKDRQEHPYDLMYIPIKSYFYIGFHARDTRRLPYNVRMTVGDEIVSVFNLPASEKRYLVS